MLEDIGCQIEECGHRIDIELFRAWIFDPGLFFIINSKPSIGILDVRKSIIRISDIDNIKNTEYISPAKPSMYFAADSRSIVYHFPNHNADGTPNLWEMTPENLFTMCIL